MSKNFVCPVCVPSKEEMQKYPIRYLGDKSNLIPKIILFDLLTYRICPKCQRTYSDY
jgi:rubredoxin